MDLRSKFQAVGLALKSQFLEREDVVDGLLCAALAGEHVLMVGAPGSAKSALVTMFTSMVSEAVCFEWLLGKFTVPEELFGPVSLKALKDEQYKRVTTGKLPEADVAFLDEVFKANSAILNTLLPVMNERKFYNNGKPAKIPLRMVVGASNELPDGAELAALYDRFLVRFSVDYLEKPDNWVRMVMSVPKGHKATITKAEWDAALIEVAAITVTEDVARELHKLREKLRSEQNLQLSDRRWKQCIGLLRAAAWLSGETEVLEDHFVALCPALWNEREQIAPVGEAVKALAGSISNEATKIVMLLGNQIGSLQMPTAGEKPSVEMQKEMVTVNREGGRALAKLKELGTQAKTERARKTVKEATAKVEGLLNPMRQTMREALGL